MEAWTWVLIFGGLLLLSLGIFVLKAGGGFGWALVACAIAAVLAGVVMIVLRSRMEPQAGPRTPPDRRQP